MSNDKKLYPIKVRVHHSCEYDVIEFDTDTAKDIVLPDQLQLHRVQASSKNPIRNVVGNVEIPHFFRPADILADATGDRYMMLLGVSLPTCVHPGNVIQSISINEPDYITSFSVTGPTGYVTVRGVEARSVGKYVKDTLAIPVINNAEHEEPAEVDEEPVDAKIARALREQQKRQEEIWRDEREQQEAIVREHRLMREAMERRLQEMAEQLERRAEMNGGLDVEAGYKAMRRMRAEAERKIGAAEVIDLDCDEADVPPPPPSPPAPEPSVKKEALEPAIVMELLDESEPEDAMEYANGVPDADEWDPGFDFGDKPAAAADAQPIEAPAAVEPIEAPAAVEPIEAPAAVEPIEAPAAVEPIEAPAAEEPIEAPAAEEPVEAPAAPMKKRAPKRLAEDGLKDKRSPKVRKAKAKADKSNK